LTASRWLPSSFSTTRVLSPSSTSRRCCMHATKGSRRR
jgi:hypothetical protein